MGDRTVLRINDLTCFAPDSIASTDQPFAIRHRKLSEQVILVTSIESRGRWEKRCYLCGCICRHTVPFFVSQGEVDGRISGLDGAKGKDHPSLRLLSSTVKPAVLTTHSGSMPASFTIFAQRVVSVRM